MVYVPAGGGDQRQIEAAVRRAQKRLAADVVRIRYNVGTDWTGEPSLFFRIVLSDHAANQARLNDTTQKVALTLLREVKAEELGLHPYFNFRSQSEQATLNEPAWT